MKRILWAMSFVFLLMALSACQAADPDGVTFYYCRDPQQYQYFQDDGVICAESRDIMGHRSDLQYMAGLYLAGPMEEGLISPFNKNTRLLSIRQVDTSILVELSEHAGTLTDSEFSLSCACFAMTCMDFIQCEDVTITCGDRSITMTQDNIILLDFLPQQETDGG